MAISLHPPLAPIPSLHHTLHGLEHSHCPRDARSWVKRGKSAHQKTDLEPGETRGATAAVYPLILSETVWETHHAAYTLNFVCTNEFSTPDERHVRSRRRPDRTRAKKPPFWWTFSAVTPPRQMFRSCNTGNTNSNPH